MEASQANAKEKYLFEKAPYFKAILKLALPSILGQLILVIYNMADTFFIGLASDMPTFLGDPNALVAGVTICMPLFMILTAISNLFGIGASSVMSRNMGLGNYEKARNASRFAIWFSVFSTVVYCLIMLLFIKPIVGFLAGYNEAVMEYSKTYVLVTVVICGIPTMLNTLLSHLFRGEGKSLHASIGIALGGILNIILDPLFIFVVFPIEKAAFSAALATGISNIIALIYYLILYAKSNHDELVISFKFKKKMLYDNVPKECLLVGLPACLMTLCENISYMILDNIIGTITLDSVTSQAALAGIGAAKKINMVAHSTVRGMTQGVLPIIGYNKTYGNRHRMRMIVYISGLISLTIALICTGVNIAFAGPLSEIFIHEADAISCSELFLTILSIGAPFSALAYTVISFFQAVGRPWKSLILALLRKGILDIPLMYILRVRYPLQGAVIATPSADIVCCIVAVILFIIYIKNHGHDRHAKNSQFMQQQQTNI